MKAGRWGLYLLFFLLGNMQYKNLEYNLIDITT